MAERRYYWLKLPEDFFRDKRIKRLRRIAGGDTYTCIYLKMLLTAMQTGGKLYFDGLEKNPADEIALDLDEDTENVSLCLNYLISAGLAELNGCDVMLTELPKMVGSETASAERKRRQRGKLPCDNVTLLSDNVQECHSDVQNCHTEKEKDKDIEKDKESVYASLGYQSISESQYNTLASEIGKVYVDKTIERIVMTPYKGCLTPEKIRQWATELKGKQRSRKTGFANYTDRGTDYDAVLNQAYKE